MDQRSARRLARAAISGVMGLLLVAACMPAPTRVSATAIGKESSLKTSLAPSSVGAAGRGGVAMAGVGGAQPPLAAPIISNNGANVLKGSVRVPASIISHNGSNIVSNNGSNIISHNGSNIISHNGSNIISHNGSNVRIAQVPLAFTTVRLKDAAGAPVRDSQGQELVTKTDANGNYAFPVEVKGRNLVIEADVAGQDGKLKSLLPKEGLPAGVGLEVDLTSTLTLAYILEQYVKGDLNTFERLPKDIEAKARVVTEEAIVEKQIALPTTLDAGAIVAKVDEVRVASSAVDDIFEEIKKLLVIAGIVREGDGLRAVDVAPGTVGASLYDKEGNLFVFSQSGHNLWRIDAAGILRTVVASGAWGYKEQPTGWLTPGYTSGAAFDAAGNLVLADTYNNRVVRISKAGRVSVVAGTGVAGFSGDGGDAKLAQLNRPSGLAIDAAGNLFVSDTENHRIRKITVDGKIQTVVGDGVAGASADGVAGTAGRINRPQGLAIAPSGDLYIADFANNRVRVLSTTGQLKTHRPELGEVHSPICLSFDANNDLVCLSHQSSQVFKFDRDALSSVLPSTFKSRLGAYFFFFSRTMIYGGDRIVLQSQPGQLVASSRDGLVEQVMGPLDANEGATKRFEFAYNLVVDASDNAFVTDMGAKRIYKIDPAGKMTTVAGNGQDWPANQVELAGPNVGIGMVSGLALANDGNLLFTTNGVSPSVCVLEPNGTVRRIVGSGKVDYVNAPVGIALQVSLANPFSVARQDDGAVVFAEPIENRLCVLSVEGVVDLMTPITSIQGPDLVKVDRSGVLYFWERGRKQISRLSPGGVVKVLGVDELSAAIGDVDIKALAFDHQNRLYVGGATKIARFSSALQSILVAGEGASVLAGSTKDEGLSSITDISFSKSGDLYVLERQQLKKVSKVDLPM